MTDYAEYSDGDTVDDYDVESRRLDAIAVACSAADSIKNVAARNILLEAAQNVARTLKPVRLRKKPTPLVPVSKVADYLAGKELDHKPD